MIRISTFYLVLAITVFCSTDLKLSGDILLNINIITMFNAPTLPVFGISVLFVYN